MDRAELKSNAKRSLKGHYGSAILVLVVYGILCAIPSVLIELSRNSSENTQGLVSFVAAILAIMISALLTIGETSFFLKLSRNKKVEFGELFSKTNLWITCFVALVLTAIFTSLWTLLLIIPGIIASYRYRLTPYVIADDPKIGGLSAITKSKELMKGHKMELFVLDLSFLGWNILAVLTFGLLYFWLAPYMNTTYANYYNVLAKRKK